MSETIYRVQWTQGNGYYCQCHRTTWNEYEDFESRESAIEFIERQKKETEDVSDFSLSTITEEESF